MPPRRTRRLTAAAQLMAARLMAAQQTAAARGTAAAQPWVARQPVTAVSRWIRGRPRQRPTKRSQRSSKHRTFVQRSSTSALCCDSLRVPPSASERPFREDRFASLSPKAMRLSSQTDPSGWLVSWGPSHSSPRETNPTSARVQRAERWRLHVGEQRTQRHSQVSLSPASLPPGNTLCARARDATARAPVEGCRERHP